MDAALRDLIVDDESRLAFRVDHRVYCDPTIFEQERHLIFERCWIYAAHASELGKPGDFVARTIAGRPMIVVRGSDGVVRALLNTCTHRGTMLCKQSSGNARVFRCPYHAWTFDTMGRLRGLPGREAYGDAFATEAFDLAAVRTESYRDFIFVTLDARSPSLSEYLAGAKEYLDLIVDQSLGSGMEVVRGTQRYGIAANWKLLAENSIDTYHVMALHRRYLDYVADQGVRPSPPRGRALQLGNGHAVSISTPPVAAKPVAYWGPPMPIAQKPAIHALQQRLRDAYGDARARSIGETYRQLLIFPNLIVNDTVATTIRTWDPVAHDRMDVTAWALVPHGQPPDERAHALQSFLTFFGPGGFATPDDVEILESCQHAFVNREVRWADCSRGMNKVEPSFDDELQVRAFWRRWRELLTGESATGTR
ncbi:MAG TPA: aromatic ring-hydroxylating dioxygenase subunit alpha [Kofleriaceae bacterium]|nr:aromatic ring-hydroxylating dioxygenase subunit alpha [Kofleriaceae bacterium]